MDHPRRHTDAELGSSRLGMEPTVAAALSYLLGFVTGILFYVAENENAYIRFHALQSTIFFGAIFIIIMFFRLIPILGFLVNFLISLCAFAIWLILIIKAAQGVAFKLPIVGDIAERNI